MTTVWIDAAGGRGATPLADAQPDATVSDMRSFAEYAE
jgi:hypothetical protein